MKYIIVTVVLSIFILNCLGQDSAIQSKIVQAEQYIKEHEGKGHIFIDKKGTDDILHVQIVYPPIQCVQKNDCFTVACGEDGWQLQTHKNIIALHPALWAIKILNYRFIKEIHVSVEYKGMAIFKCGYKLKWTTDKVPPIMFDCTEFQEIVLSSKWKTIRKVFVDVGEFAVYRINDYCY